MADEYHNKNKIHDHESEPGKVETQDRGLCDFLGKKDDHEKPHEAHQDQDVVVAEFEKVQISESSEPDYKAEEKNEEKEKHGPLQKLHRSNSSSSSSSEEEEGEGEEKKKKKKEKKGITEKIKEKIAGDHDHQKAEEEKVHGHYHHQDTAVPVEKISTEEVLHHDDQPEDHEKKGFLDNIKEKPPGQHKNPDQEHQIPPPQAEHHHEGEAKEKKGIFERIKEKLPGYHPKSSTNPEDNEDRDAHAPSH